jgi:polar amino acid transport system substrate-binding protein
MKTLNKFIAIVMVATVVAMGRYFKAPQKTADSEVVVGTSADFPPFSYIDESGTIVGFDIDLIREIFARLNRAYRIENMPFETLLPTMQFGSIDMIASGMSPTPERAARVAFSESYLQADPLTIVTRVDSSIDSLEDLSGKHVAVNQGYVADMQLSKHPEITLVRLPGMSDAMLALKHGKVDAFVTGARTIRPLQGALGKDALRIVPIAEMREETAFGISKNRPDLVEKIDTVLRDIADDGTLSALIEKWHL